MIEQMISSENLINFLIELQEAINISLNIFYPLILYTLYQFHFMIKSVSKNLTNLLTKTFFTKVEAKVQNKVGVIYMDSQKDFNALSVQMKAALVKSISQFDNSNDVKVIVLLSKVKKAFCAGANIKQFQDKSSSDFVNNDIFKQIHDTFYNSKKPIIAGVNGVALGGGCEISLLADVVFCSQQARFGLPELNLGLIPGIGGTQRLAKIAGRVNAMRYVLTSQFIPAKRAYQLGIVSQVFKTDELHSKVLQIAGLMTQKPLTALIAAKKVIKESENLSMKDGIALEREVFYPLYDTAGMKQGVAAFIQKRKANMYDL